MLESLNYVVQVLRQLSQGAKMSAILALIVVALFVR